VLKKREIKRSEKIQKNSKPILFLRLCVEKREIKRSKKIQKIFKPIFFFTFMC